MKDILSSDEVVGDGKGDLDAHPPKVFFDEYGSHYLNLRVDFWYMMDKEIKKRCELKEIPNEVGSRIWSTVR